MVRVRNLIVVIFFVSSVTAFGTPSESRAEATASPQATGYNAETTELMSVLLTGIAQELNEMLIIDRSLVLTNLNCEQANAFFLPAGEERPNDTVVFCNELIGAIAEGVRSHGRSGGFNDMMIISQMTFILMHEVGHALIHTLDLPITGREENVADQFATLLFESEPVMAIMAAQFWIDRGSSADAVATGSARAFSDTHGLNEQRFYNMLCWIYGADPHTRDFVLSRLPTDRAQTCGNDYSRGRRGMIGLLRQHLRIPESEAFPPQSESREMSGTWRFNESMGNGSERCTASGTLSFLEIGDDLSGSLSQTGQCVSNGQRQNNNMEGVIPSGSVDYDAGTFSFVVTECSYSGRFTDAERMRVEGSITCGEGFTGTWSAVR